MRKRVSLLFLGVGIFLLFVFFSYLVHKNIFTHFDFDTTVRLQDKISRRLDEPFSFLSLIGSFEPMIIVLVILLVLVRKIKGIIALFAFGMFHIFELYGKFFVQHRPPPHFLLRTEKIGNFPQFYVSTENSYPSGHAGRAAFITILIAILVWRSKKISRTTRNIILVSLLVYDVVMLTSRVYLGEHWASDVIGGTTLGSALALLSGALLY